MAPSTDHRGGLFEHLARMAPGTPLREGFERILRGRTGALVVLGRNKVIDAISTGGFALDVPFSPTALRELAKISGVTDVQVDLASGAVTIASETPIEETAVKAAVDEAGYELVSH